MAAGLDGIEKKTAPGPVLGEADESGIRFLPEDLKEAVEELGKDSLLVDVLGEEFVKVYTLIKRKEWRDFICSVTPWELDTYLTRV